MKNRSTSLYIVISVTVITTLLVVIFSAFTGGLILAPYLNEDAQAAAFAPPAVVEQNAPAQVGETDLVAAYEQALVDLYQNTLPSAVSIWVTKEVDHPPLGRFGVPTPDSEDEDSETPSIPEEFFNQGQGSGFVWDREGHIVTNYHVVVDATDVEVIFPDGRTAKAEVLGGAPDVDLAVVKVDLPASDLQPIAQGDSDSLQVGQLAIAIGSPFGQEFTMTNGIVSAIGRTIRSGNTPFSIPKVIQTDASINPGNSGGPLLNRQGEAIGINTQIATRSGSNSGVGFAIPINIAKQVVPSLIRGETYEYSWIGITGRTLSSEIIDLLDLPAETQGVLVLGVAEESPAEAAGLRAEVQPTGDEDEDADAAQPGGDVIVAIDGQPVNGMDDLITYLADETRPGDQVELDLIRSGGEQETISVTLAARPSADTFDQQNDE